MGNSRYVGVTKNVRNREVTSVEIDWLKTTVNTARIHSARNKLVSGVITFYVRKI